MQCNNQTGLQEVQTAAGTQQAWKQSSVSARNAEQLTRKSVCGVLHYYKKLFRRKKILWVAKSVNFQWSRVWTAGDKREWRMALQTIPTIYQQGEYNRRQTEERQKTYILATDLKCCPRGSPAGTTTDPCSHRTRRENSILRGTRWMKRVILDIYSSSPLHRVLDCLVCNLKLSVDGLLCISLTSSS